MAEYCEIRGRFRHPVAAMRTRLVTSYRRCRVAQEFLPISKRYLHGERYGIRREIRWGTQEEFGQGEYAAAPVRRGDQVELHFETSNGAPLGVFIELRRLGFTVEADYWDPGSGFCGYLRDDTFDESRITCWNPACVRRHLDAAVVKLFGIDDGCFFGGKACTHGSGSWSYSRGRTLEEYFANRSKLLKKNLKGWERALRNL